MEDQTIKVQKKSTIYFLLLVIIFISCNKKQTLFNKLDSSQSGIRFRNDIQENDSMNILDLENIYNGGGVGIADFNNDGLADIYFTGNMVANKLYLNKGKLKFDDVTSIARAEGEEKWSRGISIVDINNDGWQDIYISCTILKDSVKRENILYINQGLNKEGIPVFKDMAQEYSLNDNSHTTQAAFFDYDNDGDLDVYLAVNVFAKRDNPNIFRKIFTNGEHPNTDRLYRNDWDSAKGHPVFTNVSRAAGILQEGFAHSVTVCDINQDGWKDIFITNDYLSENILYVNNSNGTFANKSKEYFKHTAYNAMGADVVDINNDGLSDVIELDMNPEDNYRKKTMLGSGNYQSYLYNNDYNYQYQYVRNNLHLNMGNSVGSNDSTGHPVFSDISFYSGVAETDWSWTPLVADFDNDGYRDLIVTNGFPKDVTDHDFMAFRNSAFGMNDKAKLLSQIPEVKISNYAFHNNGKLKFSNVTKDWGLDLPTFSNGAATADLDNDGDLDIVINNINDEALLYENNQNELKNEIHHYLQVKLEGNMPNKGAFGSWVKIYYDKDKIQVYETNPVRGYLSSIQNIISFGLDGIDKLDSLVIIWPDSKKQILKELPVDRQLLVKQLEATETYSWQRSLIDSNALFSEVSRSLGLDYKHQQKDFNDFAIQKLLPHKLSQYGPPMATGDINNDGTEDLIIGGSNGRSETIFLQQQDGRFQHKNLYNSTADTSQPCIDMGLELFDADNDNDPDLYIAVGGYEVKAGSPFYQDKLYINDGKGNFIKDSTAIPVSYSSNSCVRSTDFDKDGDLDLFIGGRVEPWAYPKPVSCIILRNDSKNRTIKFTDITKEVAPELLNIGLVCDAAWSDYDNDGWPDLILAGEWMPVTIFKNIRGKLTNVTAATGIGNKAGWWNCIKPADIDNDGDIDFIAGNAGENSFFSDNDKYPVNNYYNDFDKNGTFKSITTRFLKDKNADYSEFTTHSRDEVVDQIPSIKKNFLSYKSFAEAPMNKLFSQKALVGVFRLKADYFSTSVIMNNGNGKFELLRLPPEAQLSSVFGIETGDFNSDGKVDLILSGNDYSTEVFNGRLDALNGLFLSGNGKGGFTVLPISQSGIYIPGDGKALVKLKRSNGMNLIIASQNKGIIRAFINE
jgi:hypothetical protein